MNVTIAYQSSINAVHRIRRELIITWQVIKYNISASIIPSMMVTLASVVDAQASVAQWRFALLKGFILSFLYIYSFDLSGQLNSSTEDRFNKPDRPIPSGLLTREGMRFRLYTSVGVFLVAGPLFGVGLPSLLWIVSFLLYHHTSLGRNWIAKNLTMSIGTWVMIYSAWQVGGGLSNLGILWAFCTAVILFPTVSIQDLRDVEGDAAIGRRTIPIIMGDSSARVYIMIAMLAAIPYMYVTMYIPSSINTIQLMVGIIPSVVLITVAARVILCKGKKADHLTYMLFTIWYIFHVSTMMVYAIST